jgi:hypothetical protein
LSNVIGFPNRHVYHEIMALCLKCHTRWVGMVTADWNLFYLECPHCHQQESFASFASYEYEEDLETKFTPKPGCKIFEFPRGKDDSQETLA